MKLIEYCNRLERLHLMISHKSTGTPKELAKKLNISERRVYDYINYFKLEFGAQIHYNKTTKTYEYLSEEGLEVIIKALKSICKTTKKISTLVKN